MIVDLRGRDAAVAKSAIYHMQLRTHIYWLLEWLLEVYSKLSIESRYIAYAQSLLL
jgi:hypothetical protein